jgi:carbonic anhydrase/acetyltransferase-like protein (isoleucine patch superfamily)
MTAGSRIWEVFRQDRKGQPFEHAGSVVAPGMSIATVTAGPPILRLMLPESAAGTVHVGSRVLVTDTVVLKAGATLGPNSVILPAATLGRHATVGPASLVMRGEEIPSRTRWIGNPVGPWEGESDDRD